MNQNDISTKAFRVPKLLWKKFKMICANEGLPVSTKLSQLMSDYIGTPGTTASANKTLNKSVNGQSKAHNVVS